MKKWWFSIFCFSTAIILLVYTIISIFLFDDDLLFYNLILMSSASPIMFIVFIGSIDLYSNDKKDELEKAKKKAEFLEKYKNGDYKK